MLSASWLQVFAIFLLPWGPGAAAGIVLAKRTGLPAGLTIGLYISSDVVTAFVLEPLVRLLHDRGQKSKVGRKILETVGRLGSISQVTSGRLGLPFGLFVFTFATDFFTAAIVSTGLALARPIAWLCIIAGDVLWFLIIFLASIGIAAFMSDDRVLFVGTLALGFVLPPLMRRLFAKPPARASDPR